MKAKVILFKRSGKYYTEEEWEIPENCIIPAYMERSPDFRRIDDGPVLVDTQEPWGYPHLFPGEPHNRHYAVHRFQGVRDGDCLICGVNQDNHVRVPQSGHEDCDLDRTCSGGPYECLHHKADYDARS